MACAPKLRPKPPRLPNGAQLLVLSITHCGGKALKPKTGLQAKARTARYDLLSSWCKANDVTYLLTGHTMDDQAETVLMRQQRTDTAESLAGIWETADLGRGESVPAAAGTKPG